MTASARLNNLVARTILDSRGERTLEVELRAGGERTVASVPAGRSRGRREAAVLPADEAVTLINETIAPALRDQKLDLMFLDNRLLTLDGTADKSRLGGNTTLAVSLAVARLGARLANQPLWRYLANLAGTKPATPRLLANLINGGVHAGSQLQLQEFMVIPPRLPLSRAIGIVVRVYQVLRAGLLSRFGPMSVNLGDEGGFAPPLRDDRLPLGLIRSAAAAANVGEIDLGIDAAGSSLRIKPHALRELYDQLIRDYQLWYLEDPFAEDDLESHAEILTNYPRGPLIVGDDLTVTNARLIEAVAIARAANGVIIKPNQVGTLTETFQAVAAARAHGWQVFVSHRSGETNDDFIADLACAIGATGFKLGAPARGERIAKYNRLLMIEREGLEL